MTKPNLEQSHLEQSLCEALDAAGRDYEQAVRAIQVISHEITEGNGHGQTFGRLQQIAVSTRETEVRVSRLRDDWHRQGQRPGNRLQAVLKRQENILRNLIHSLNEAEEVARSVRGKVIQRVDDSTRSHQMHSAYARTVRQAAE